MTKTLAIEWAAQRVLVNSVAPSIILTTGMHNYPPGTAEQAARTIPLKRLGRADEVASAVSYLLSPAGDFITGETLRLDGGSSLWGERWRIPDPPAAEAIEIPPWPEERWPEHVPKDAED